MDLYFNLSDYETLRALDADNIPTGPSMTEEEINALPVHKYKVSGPQRLVNAVTKFHPTLFYIDTPRSPQKKQVREAVIHLMLFEFLVATSACYIYLKLFVLFFYLFIYCIFWGGGGGGVGKWRKRPLC